MSSVNPNKYDKPSHYRRKMNLREKMKTCGVTLTSIAKELPSNNYPQVCNILNEKLSARVHEIAERLCEEKAEELRSALNSI